MIRSTITIRESRGTLSHRKSNTFSVSKMVDAVPLQSDFGRYIINDGAKTRRRDRREDKRRLACEEAVTKSRLSCHMVKFENSIKKHNLIFLRFHHISDDVQKRGRRSTYSFNQTQSQCGIRAEQMLNLDQAILPKEFKFRETGRHLAKMIRLEKQGFVPTAEEKDEDINEEPKVEEEKPKPIFTKKLVPMSLLSRSLDYRRFVEKLQDCKLLNSLLVIRQPMVLRRILAQANISDHETIEFDPFYYSHYKQINEISIR